MNIGLYVHIPFCLAKCAYCDFISYAGKQSLFDTYINALKIEAENRRTEQTITSVYIGGGTPTILNEYQLLRVFEIIFNCFTLAEDAEFTIECNPATADTNKLKVLKQAGINRLSLGVQSNSDAILKAIGRVHSYKDFLRTYNDAREAGFDNINIDIMYGLPGQTFSHLYDFIGEIELLRPEHVSAYSLILEEGTPLYVSAENGSTALPDNDVVADMMQYINNTLPKTGYSRYEISNFAQPERECRHNLLYWSRGNYIGLGCAAHSLWNEKRRENTPDIQNYISLQQFTEIQIAKNDAMFERIMLALRTSKGLNTIEFKKEFSIDIADIYSLPLNKHISLGNLIKKNEYIRPTEKGMDILNSVLVDFL